MSGYDYTFACEVPREYSCPICECPMREPVQTKCGHRFCKGCLQKALKRKRKCPIDRGHLNERSKTDIYPDVAVERAILDLMVQCPNESNGCKWTGELRIVKTHEAGCDFIGVKCTNKDCKVTPLKKDLLKHVTDECPMREVQCQYCDTPFVWCQRQDHFDVCSKYPVCCVQNCGEQKIPRDQMNDHIEESCAVTKVDCTFAHIGCEVKVQRRAIAEHVQENTEHHLKLACEKLQEFQVLSTVNTANLEELEVEMVTAKRKIAELSEAVTETNGMQGLIYNKIALTDDKLNQLPKKDEVDALIGEVKELQDEKLLEVQDKVSGLRVLSTVNTANVKELEAEIATTKKKITELSEAVMKNSGLQAMIYNKIALTDEKLNELPEKDEVDSLIAAVKVLQGEKLLEVQDEVSELQIRVYRGLQSLQRQVSGTETKVLTLRNQRQSDRQQNNHLWSRMRDELRDLRDETDRDKILLQEVRDQLSASQQWWQRIVFVFQVVSVIVFLLVCLSGLSPG